MQLEGTTRFRALRTASTVLAILLAGTVALFAIDLLIVGEPLIGVSESREAIQGLPKVTTVEYGAYPAAAIPLVGMILLIAGVLTHRLYVAWIGWGILLVFSGLFLFSTGATLLPATSLLLALLVMISFLRGQVVAR